MNAPISTQKDLNTCIISQAAKSSSYLSRAVSSVVTSGIPSCADLEIPFSALLIYRKTENDGLTTTRPTLHPLSLGRDAHLCGARLPGFNTPGHSNFFLENHIHHNPILWTVKGFYPDSSARFACRLSLQSLFQARESTIPRLSY